MISEGFWRLRLKVSYKKYNFYASNISVSKFNTLIPGLRDPKQGLLTMWIRDIPVYLIFCVKYITLHMDKGLGVEPKVYNS